MLVTSLTVAVRCPLCGARHAACGPRTATAPVDLRSEEVPRMASTRLYTVVINGVQRQMRLNDHDAQQLGATPVDTGGSAGSSDVGDKARRPANKARRTTTSRDRDES